VEKRARPDLDQELGESISQRTLLNVFRHLTSV
jgi:hypothetical protein